MEECHVESRFAQSPSMPSTVDLPFVDEWERVGGDCGRRQHLQGQLIVCHDDYNSCIFNGIGK
jgi:hypothetical protein